MLEKSMYQWAIELLQGRPRHRGRSSGRIRSLQAAETGLSEVLESRMLLSASTPVAGLSFDDSGENDDVVPNDNFEDDEETPADEAVQVTGAYLTSGANGNTRAMFCDDVRQGQLNTCTFASVLAAATLTNFNLEGGITVLSQNANTIVYGVRMYARNALGQFAVSPRTVVFDGTIQPADLRPADQREYWTAIYQRAYLDLASSLGAEYRSAPFAMQSLFGAEATETTNDASVSRAQQIKTALLAGKATIAATRDPADPADYFIEGTSGLVYNHSYTVMGIDLPASSDLSRTYVTVRNPWGIDTSISFFDTDHNNSISLAEYSNYTSGMDVSNDGLIRLPWNVFASSFETVAISARTGPSINNPMPLNTPIVFAQPNIGPFTVFEGQRLDLTITATDPEGLFPYYSVLGSAGYIQVQTGKVSWEPPANSRGTHVVKIRAEVSPLESRDMSFVVNVISGAPRIGSVHASPTTIRRWQRLADDDS